MKHYICKGTCGGVSDHSDTCHDASCPMNNKPFEECNCADPESHKKSEESKGEDY
ncbi:MAG: hypothetical protein WA057_01645 [Candidatus Magasanikiibacteriota bacterium]